MMPGGARTGTIARCRRVPGAWPGPRPSPRSPPSCSARSRGRSSLPAPPADRRAPATLEAPWRSAARASVLASIQADRDAAGLVAYLRDPALDEVAQARVERLAADGSFGHVAAGADILDPVQAAGVRPFAAGEAQGWASDDSIDAADRTHPRDVAREPRPPGDHPRGLGQLCRHRRGDRRRADPRGPRHRGHAGPHGPLGRDRRDDPHRVVDHRPLDRDRPTPPGPHGRRRQRDGRVAAGRRALARDAGAGARRRRDRSRSVPAGHAVDVRVRALDRAGNASPWATARVPVLP